MRPSGVAPMKPVTTGTMAVVEQRDQHVAAAALGLFEMRLRVAKGVAGQNEVGRCDGNGGDAGALERGGEQARAEAFAERRQPVEQLWSRRDAVVQRELREAGRGRANRARARRDRARRRRVRVRAEHRGANEAGLRLRHALVDFCVPREVARCARRRRLRLSSRRRLRQRASSRATGFTSPAACNMRSAPSSDVPPNLKRRFLRRGGDCESRESPMPRCEQSARCAIEMRG